MFLDEASDLSFKIVLVLLARMENNVSRDSLQLS